MKINVQFKTSNKYLLLLFYTICNRANNILNRRSHSVSIGHQTAQV